MIEVNQLRPLSQFARESNNCFTEASLRWIRFNEESNGFKGAFITVGRRVFVHVPTFNKCLTAQQQPERAA